MDSISPRASVPSDEGYPIRPFSPVSRLEEVEVRIKEYIAENDLKPGDRCPANPGSVAQLGVGRPLVREAFKGLEAVGVIEARKGVGRFVRAFDAETYLRHFTTQMLIQPSAIANSSRPAACWKSRWRAMRLTRLTDDDLAEIQRLWQAIVADTAAGVTNSGRRFWSAPGDHEPGRKPLHCRHARCRLCARRRAPRAKNALCPREDGSRIWASTSDRAGRPSARDGQRRASRLDRTFRDDRRAGRIRATLARGFRRSPR